VLEKSEEEFNCPSIPVNLSDHLDGNVQEVQSSGDIIRNYSEVPGTSYAITPGLVRLATPARGCRSSPETRRSVYVVNSRTSPLRNLAPARLITRFEPGT
jgi:hypothetical protein